MRWLFVAVLWIVPTLASAQAIELVLPADALRIDESIQTEASCRSCIGRHTSLSVRASIAEGPLMQVELFVDYVGSPRAQIELDSGPYPARGTLRVRRRDAASQEDLHGALSYAVDRGEIVLVFTASSPSASIRTITFPFPRGPAHG